MPSSLIPARSGAYSRLRTGQKIKIISTYGEQVVDTWAFAADNSSTYLSMSHTRASLRKLIPGVGDVLVSNTRQPMLALVEDSTSGIHDTLFAACDKHRYEQLGVQGYHDSCSDNLHREASKASVDLREDWTPDPLNLFMNVSVGNMSKGGKRGMEPPSSTKGQYVIFEAKCDCIVFFSACPQDLVPGNGGKPTSAEFELYD
ncbi:MAG: hypothetical protein M1830_008832 [Pleopsidium flavum]|nr:MAG: hypothetical protein M1830_008832 [Pleopsidium flavum]